MRGQTLFDTKTNMVNFTALRVEPPADVMAKSKQDIINSYNDDVKPKADDIPMDAMPLDGYEVFLRGRQDR